MAVGTTIQELLAEWPRARIRHNRDQRGQLNRL